MMGVDGHKYKGIVDCYVRIYKTQGTLGFYSGLGPRLTRHVMAVALIFTIYHKIRETAENLLLETDSNEMPNGNKTL